MSLTGHKHKYFQVINLNKKKKIIKMYLQRFKIFHKRSSFYIKYECKFYFISVDKLISLNYNSKNILI